MNDAATASDERRRMGELYSQLVAIAQADGSTQPQASILQQENGIIRVRWMQAGRRTVTAPTAIAALEKAIAQAQQLADQSGAK